MSILDRLAALEKRLIDLRDYRGASTCRMAQLEILRLLRGSFWVFLGSSAVAYLLGYWSAWV